MTKKVDKKDGWLMLYPTRRKLIFTLAVFFVVGFFGMTAVIEQGILAAIVAYLLYSTIASYKNHKSLSFWFLGIITLILLLTYMFPQYSHRGLSDDDSSIISLSVADTVRVCSCFGFENEPILERPFGLCRGIVYDCEETSQDEYFEGGRR